MTKRSLTPAGWYAKFTSRGLKRTKAQAPYRELTKLLGSLDGTSLAPDILFFGDSVSLRVSRDDSDTDTLDQMLARKLGGKDGLLSIAHTAYHAEVYRSLIEVLRITPARPKLVILPVNLRSFSPQWDLYPEWQFREEIEAVESYLADPSLGIMSVNDVVATPDRLRQFDATHVKFSLTDKTRIGEFRSAIASKPKNEQQKAARLREIFIYHYTGQIGSDHRKLAAFEGCVRTLASLRIPHIVYVTPINWEAGTKYVGRDFVTAVKANVATIAGALSGHQEATGTRFADLSMTLGADCFFSSHDPTEHLNQRGRGRLTDELVEAYRGAIDQSRERP